MVHTYAIVLSQTQSSPEIYTGHYDESENSAAKTFEQVRTTISISQGGRTYLVNYGVYQMLVEASILHDGEYTTSASPRVRPTNHVRSQVLKRPLLADRGQGRT